MGTHLITMRLIVLALLSSIMVALTSASSPPTAVVVHEWVYLNFTSPIPSDEEFIPENCMLAGVKQGLPTSDSSPGPLFVSVPRWKTGVPATLSTVDPETGDLVPFPSWEANDIAAVSRGEAKAEDVLFSVLGFEIDATNTVWVLDQGKVDNTPAVPGAIKLVAYDVETGEEVWKMVFDAEIASPERSFLNDLVVDRKHGVIFISDSGIPTDPSLPTLGGIIAVDIVENTVVRLLSGTDQTNAAPDLWIHINGDPVLADARMRTGADGIALTPDLATLVFCPLTSHHFYAVPTIQLRAALADNNPNAHIGVIDLGDRGFASDGLGYSNESTLYLTSLEGSGIMTHYNDTLVQNSVAMVWPDTIGWDHAGSLLFTSNKLYKYMEGKLDPSTSNFHIYSVDVGADSYLAGILPPQ